jgi:hypothetical protein
MIVAISVAETYVQSILVKVPDGSSEEMARRFIQDEYNKGRIVVDINACDFLDGSAEIQVAYSDKNEYKFGDPDYTLNEEGLAI